MPRKKKSKKEEPTPEVPEVADLGLEDDDLTLDEVEEPAAEEVSPEEALVAELAGRKEEKKAKAKSKAKAKKEEPEPEPEPAAGLVSTKTADEDAKRIAELEARLAGAVAREAELERQIRERDERARKVQNVSEEAIAEAWANASVKMPAGHMPFSLDREKTLVNIAKSPITWVDPKSGSKYTAPPGAMIPMSICPQWQKWRPRYFIQFRGDPRGRQAVVPGFSKRHSSY